MKLLNKPVVVISGWLLVNLVLAGLLAGFRENPFAYVLYFTAAVPLTVLALIIWRIGAEPREHQQFAAPGSTGPVILLAVGATVVGLGLVYQEWLAIIGALIVLLALVGLFSRRGRTAGRPAELAALPVATPDGPPVAGHPAESQPEPDHPARRRWLRRGARR